MTDPMIEQVRSTLTRAVATIDSLEDLEAICDLGAPADVLSVVLGELDKMDAALSLTPELAAAAHDVLCSTDKLFHRATWLRDRAGLDATQAGLVASLPAQDADFLLDLATLRSLREIVWGRVVEEYTLLDAALTEVLKTHAPATVPDTIPAAWT